MEITKKNDAILKVNPKNNEKRIYYLFPTFEFIVTEIPPFHKQPFHLHEKTIEFVYIIDGEMVAHEGSEKVNLVKGECVCFAPSNLFHTIENPSNEILIVATFKTPHSSISYRDIFRQDKILKNNECGSID